MSIFDKIKDNSRGSGITKNLTVTLPGGTKVESDIDKPLIDCLDRILNRKKNN